MLIKTIKTIIPLLFIPIVIASTKTSVQALKGMDLLNVNLYLVTGGFLAYPIFHIVFLKPMYIYSVGHEIIHVLATWLCGGKVTSFHVSHAGGNVTTTKTNLFIRLAPYFVPIHTIFLFLLYWALSKFYNISQFSNEFIFLIGFTMSFHVFMTIEVMKMRQPDIIKTGYFFSVLFIYVANIFVAVLVLSFIFRDISFVTFAKNTFALSKDIYLNIFGRLVR
ncbi:MAG: hypothetical protein WBC74_03190 [Candidatus Omnitrophota bacterium]